MYEDARLRPTAICGNSFIPAAGGAFGSLGRGLPVRCLLQRGIGTECSREWRGQVARPVEKHTDPGCHY